MSETEINSLKKKQQKKDACSKRKRETVRMTDRLMTMLFIDQNIKWNKFFVIIYQELYVRFAGEYISYL